MTDYRRRRGTLLEWVEADGFVVLNSEGSDAASLYYLTGFFGEGALLIRDGKEELVTDSRYTEQAEREAPDLALRHAKGEYLEALADTLRGTPTRRVAFSSRRMTYYTVEKARSLFEGVEFIPLEDPVSALRLVKGEEEATAIREATRVAEEALAEAVDRVRVGMTEREIALRLEIGMRERGADGVSFDLIVAAGANSSLPHYRPGEVRLKKGDLLLFDIGARYRGYCSDLTRTVSVGRPPAWAVEVYELVRRANRAGVAAVRAGVTGKDADAAAREVIVAGGHGEHFGHGLGHGVGLEVHEGPRLSPLSTDSLAVGMVTSVEPGVYLPGRGGVRIEDLVLVKAAGCEVLTSFPHERLLEVG
jgi:Xaa-Pro aminopeptidase